MAIRLPRGLNINQPHGTVYFSNDNMNIDAGHCSLTGLETPKASYNAAKFGAFVGGPLNIPKIFNGGNKWFFFAGWNGSRGSTAFLTNIDRFTWPPALLGNSPARPTKRRITRARRYASPQPASKTASIGQANVINPTMISPSAQALLQYIPLPNLNTPTQNFHFVTNDNNNTDAVSFRLIPVHEIHLPFGPPQGDAREAQAVDAESGGGGRRARRTTSTSA